MIKGMITGPLREIHNIEGSAWKDCGMWIFCPLCEITRELREVRAL